MSNFFATNAIYEPMKLFSIEHIIGLIICFILQFVVLRYAKKDNKWLCKTLSILIIIEECFNFGWLFKAGARFLLIRGLPLWHCSVAMILLIIASFNNNEKLLKLGSYFGFIGSLCALIFPGSLLNYHFSFPHIVHISHFSAHLYLLLVSSYNLFIRKIGMTKQDYKFAMIVVLIFNIIMSIYNAIMGTNYAFVTKLLYGSFCAPPIASLIIVTIYFWALAGILYFLIKYNKIK